MGDQKKKEDGIIGGGNISARRENRKLAVGVKNKCLLGVNHKLTMATMRRRSYHPTPIADLNRWKRDMAKVCLCLICPVPLVMGMKRKL